MNRPDSPAIPEAAAITSAPRPKRRLGRKRAAWLAGGLILVSFGLGVLLLTAPPVSSFQADSPLVGHEEPPTEAKLLVGGSSFNLTSLRGHYVVIDFFASWCVPCQREQSQLALFAFDKRHGARFVQVIFHDSTSDARSFLGPQLGQYPVLVDAGGVIALDYGVANPPEKYIVNPQGKVLVKVIGATTESALNSFIAADIRRRALSPPSTP